MSETLIVTVGRIGQMRKDVPNDDTSDIPKHRLQFATMRDMKSILSEPVIGVMNSVLDGCEFPSEIHEETGLSEDEIDKALIDLQGLNVLETEVDNSTTRVFCEYEDMEFRMVEGDIPEDLKFD